MSRLLENILSKSNKIGFDFSKSYNKQNVDAYATDVDNQLPIYPKEASWETINDGCEKLNKSYNFKTGKHLLFFVNEVLKLSEKKYHHPEVLINHRSVNIKLYTNDVNAVTELDLNMADIIDEIFDDIFYVQGF